MASAKSTSTSAGPSAPGEGRPLQQSTPQYMHAIGAQWFLDFVIQGDLFGPAVFMRPTCVPDAEGADNILPLGTIVACAKTPGGLLKLHTNGLYDECRLPLRGVKGVLVTIKSFAGYGWNMTLCSHFKGLYDGGSKRLLSPEQYLDLALMVPKERSVLPREHVFRLLPPHEGSSGLAQETPGAAVGRGSPIQDAGGRVKGRARSVHTQVGPDAPGNTSDLHSQGTGTQRVSTPKLIKVRCGGDTYSLRDETRRESGRSGQDIGGNEAEGMGAVRESSGGEQTPSEKKRERQRMVQEEVAEGTLRMKRMRGKSEVVMGGDGGDVGERALGKRPPKEEGGTASKKARRPDGSTIREGQAVGGGDSPDPGAAAAREPSGKSKQKVAAEEGDGQKKPRRQKTAEAVSGGERLVGEECDEAAAFWLEYERNDGSEIVEKELPVQLLIDPRKVCDVPSWERYYNHRSLNRETVDDIKAAMLSQFHDKKGKIWTKNPLVLAPIYKPVTRRPEKVDMVHKDVFKPEDKDKYYYYPVNGQHTVAAVKELEGEPIFDLWNMHSWPARVVWFSDRDFAGYRQVSLNENTRHKMSKQRSQKAAFLDMREAWEKEGRPMAIQGNPSDKETEKRKFFEFQKLILGKSPNESHWVLAEKDLSLADKEYVVAVGDALRQWMPLVTAGDDVFRKAMEFYAKWAEGKLLGGDGKTPLLRPGEYMPDKSPGLQAITEMGSKGAAGETKMGWLVRVPPPPTKKKTQADDKFFVVVKEPDMFCWQCLADMTNVEKLSILDDILALRGVFVQSAGGHLKRQHKPGIKDMVATRKVDRVMLRMFHYILFLETEEDERVWRQGSPFFRTEGKLLEEFGPQGLTKQVWVEMRKHFQGVVEYVNTCKHTLPHEKESIDDAKRLYDGNRFLKSFEKSVRSILRRTEEEVRDTIRVSGDVRHIKWPDHNRVTCLIPFTFPRSQAHSHVTAIREVVRHYVCNLYVLNLCDPTLLTDWREDDFTNLQGVLQTLSPTHWALVVFFPSRWELSFLKGMVRLSVHHIRTRKWVRNAQKQVTVREDNMVVEECDRLRRRNLVFGMLNGYHDAPREYVSHFLRRLEHVYFTLAKPLTFLKNYKSQFDEEDPFDAEDMEELSDSETFDFESMPLPRVVGQVGDEEEGGPWRYSTSPASLKRVFRGEPVDDQSSDDGEEDRDYDHEPCDRLPEDHDTWQNDRLYFFSKHHWFTAEDVWGHNVVCHPKIFQPAVRNGMWVMAMKEADGKWSGLKRLGAGAFKRTARTALVEHLSLMNPERTDPGVAAYAEQKLNELYANNMLEFRVPFYTLKTPPSRGIDRRMPQPPSSGQHPGGGGGGDEGDGGGGGGDDSQFAGKGTGKTSSVEKASGGTGSGGKDSGGKGSGGKGSGEKRRTSASPQYMETDPHCVGSRDSDMRDKATLRSDQERVDSHLSARTSFPVAEESPSRRAQSEGATFGSLGSGDRYKLRLHSDLLTSPSAISAPHAIVLRGQENVTSCPPHLQVDTGLPCSPPFSCVETRDWRSRDVLEGPAAGVLETKGSEHERHTPGEEERSPGTRAVHREEETQRWQSRKVLETEGSECERHASEGASVDTDSESAGAPGETHALQRGEETRHRPAREDVKWFHTRALVIGTSEEVLHSRSTVAMTREGVVKGGQWTFVQAPVLGDDEDEEEPAVEARVHGDEKGGEPVVEGGEVTVDIRTDPQRKDGDCSPTPTELVSDSGVAEMQNVESSVEGGEVAVGIKMFPERKDHDSPSTRCCAEQGDRASVLSTGREMVLHEAIDLPSDSAATELVSDTAVAEVQNLESSVDVGAVARQEGEFPQR
ncbi:hypothetical protein CBR_g39696 [Chara braunii]|uniref:Uncharacterized protein n=1 Tax=Chara braunii TaxID=69332 RepID=A0A388LS09_CHABU|nr:hypothetical protein CBR_g39696 [Chara braunii]|eukprot:GBG85130.1 hypothetical protein CBR_g39696 [Chara braunii]